MTDRLRVRAANGRLVTAHELEQSNALERLSAEFESFKDLMNERDKNYAERYDANAEAVKTAREEQKHQAESLSEKISLGREEVERQLKLLDASVNDLQKSRSGIAGEREGSHNKGDLFLRLGLLAIAALQLLGMLLIHYGK